LIYFAAVVSDLIAFEIYFNAYFFYKYLVLN